MWPSASLTWNLQVRNETAGRQQISEMDKEVFDVARVVHTWLRVAWRGLPQVQEETVSAAGERRAVVSTSFFKKGREAGAGVSRIEGMSSFIADIGRVFPLR